MLQDNKIWIASSNEGEPIYLNPKMANRHGLIAGATGSGKTVTLKVLAESFSAMGVPVFLSDVKGDLAGMCESGSSNEDMEKRIRYFALSDTSYEFKSYPTLFWDLFGKQGIQLRTTISEMGPLLLSRILDLNELQSGILTIVFKIADDEGLILTDTKDLKAMLSKVSEEHKAYESEYGKMSTVSIAAITRAVVALELSGGDVFFGEPAINITDLFSTDSSGRGIINILDSTALINSSLLYSTFLLWLLSELFEVLPEVGDRDKPKLVFFFDEAHLLFKGTSKALLEKIEQVVKLIRSKGVGVFFITQNPRDVPDGVLSQLGTKIEHALHAYTPSDQKAVKAAAASFRANPAFDTYEAMLSLGTGEAILSLLDEDGVPGIAQLARILPPESKMGPISAEKRDSVIKDSLLYTRYANAVDNISAYEVLKRAGAEAEAAAQAEAAEKTKRGRNNEPEESAFSAAARKTAKSVSTTLGGTVGREVGKQAGSVFGSFGKRLGGNIGAALGRGILGTFFSK